MLFQAYVLSTLHGGTLIDSSRDGHTYGFTSYNAAYAFNDGADMAGMRTIVSVAVGDTYCVTVEVMP